MDNPEKRLRTRWETGKLIAGLIKVQSLAVRVEGGTTEPKVVECLIFIIAYPARSFFTSVDQMLPAAESRAMSATEALKMSHCGLGHLGVFWKNDVWRVGGGVEQRGDEWRRTDTPNDGSAGGAVKSDGWLVFYRAKFGFFGGWFIALKTVMAWDPQNFEAPLNVVPRDSRLHQPYAFVRC